ncbi:MAG: spheroidene monooxygenase [Bacteroidota bacterium]|jgi:hypothetical protein
MNTIIIVARYRTWAIPFAFISMALFHLIFVWNRKLTFYKLMGSGKNGSFDIVPDLHQWVILINTEECKELSEEHVYSLTGVFFRIWNRIFTKNISFIFLQPLQGHGQWDGSNPFKGRAKSDNPNPVATLTRATIRLRKLKAFWSRVAPVASTLPNAKGFCFSLGFGEIPWVKQATFSVWKSEEDLKHFAYTMTEHKNVIQSTRKGDWYSEELFHRFEVLSIIGPLKTRME